MRNPVVLRAGTAAAARGEAARTARRRPLRAATALLLLLPQLTACYTYVPVVSTAVPPGTEVSVSVTDRGRVELTEAVGPGVRWIAGNVMGSTDSSLILSVGRVQHLDLSVPVRWAGERVEVSRDYLAEVREKRLSRTRTGFMLALVAAAAVGASAIAIDGFGSDPGDTRPDDDGGGSQTIRIPLFIR